MKSLFRILAAAIVITAIGVTIANVRRFGIRDGVDWRAVSGIIGLMLILPTLTAYALFGEQAGNRVLVRLNQILNIPTMLLERWLSRHVEVPPELLSQPPQEKKLDKPDQTV